MLYMHRSVSYWHLYWLLLVINVIIILTLEEKSQSAQINTISIYLSPFLLSLSLSLSPPLSLFFLLLLSSLILISFKKNPILLLISQFYFTPITLSRRRGFQTRNFRRWLTVIRSRVRLPNVISLRCKQNRTLPSPLRWNEFTLYAGPPFHVCDANFPCACKRQLPHR